MEDALGNITKNTYYADGKIQSTTDPLGNVTRYTYDACGRTESVTNADGGVVRYEYTPGGAVSKITDPLGNATLYEYDANGQRSKAVNAAGNVIQYRYDSMRILMTEAQIYEAYVKWLPKSERVQAKSFSSSAFPTTNFDVFEDEETLVNRVSLSSGDSQFSSQ